MSIQPRIVSKAVSYFESDVCSWL